MVAVDTQGISVDSGIDLDFPLRMHQNHVKSCFRERAEIFTEAYTVFEIVYTRWFFY
jgi:hypothetical protein